MRMPLQPENWNVVVLGKWNEALFTPAAIARNIFKVPGDTPIEVYAVLDDVQLPRVKHDRISIAPSSRQIVIAPESCTFGELERARRIAREAISDLPRTPLIAAGFNLRYRADATPESLARRFSEDLDRRFTDRDFRILVRRFERVVTLGSGQMLVQVTRDPDDKAELLLNFERRSSDAQALAEWLSLPIAEVRQTAIRVLSEVLELGENDYVTDDDNADDHNDDHNADGEHEPRNAEARRG